MTTKAKDAYKILICGSQNFEYEGFVHNTLEMFNHVLKKSGSHIKNLMTSQTSGACAFARNWMEHQNETLPDEFKMSHKDYTFSLNLDKNNSHIYDELDLPDYVLQNDEFFIKGKENMQAMKLQYILAFPNPDGIIGAQTKNIMRFAQLAEVPVLDTSEIMAQFLINSMKQEQSNIQAKTEIEEAKMPVEKVTVQPAPLGFNNRHRAKTMR